MHIPKAQIIRMNGKREFAVIPYVDFLRIREELEDYEDLRWLRHAKKSEEEAPTVGLSALRMSLAKGANRPTKRSRRRS
jgi:hypothetical protein